MLLVPFKFPLLLTSMANSVAGVAELSVWILWDRMVFEVVNQVRKSHKALVSSSEFVEARVFSDDRKMYNTSWML